MFGLTTCVSAQVREKPDDPLNYFIGGCVGGLTLGARSEWLPPGQCVTTDHSSPSLSVPHLAKAVTGFSTAGSSLVVTRATGTHSTQHCPRAPCQLLRPAIPVTDSERRPVSCCGHPCPSLCHWKLGTNAAVPAHQGPCVLGTGKPCWPSIQL